MISTFFLQIFKKMQNTTTMTNDAIVEELTSTIETIANLCKNLQGLSGKLSSLASQCQDVQKYCSHIQSHVDKSKKMLSMLDSTDLIEKSDYVLSEAYKKLDRSHPVIHNGTFDPIKSPKKRYHSTYGFHFSSQTPDRTLKIIFNLLILAANHGGYAYGGFVRDVLVPRFINNENSIEFKDVDIWFRSVNHIKTFVRQFNQGAYSLRKNTLDFYGNDKCDKKSYGVDYRQQYILYFCDMEVAYIDLVASKFLPVNDFAINLLTFIPQEEDFTNITDNWFIIAQNNDCDSHHYSVDILLESISFLHTDILSGYFKTMNDSFSQNHMKRISDMRISRLKEWGWTLNNENLIRKTINSGLNEDLSC